jgi:hypothetical protein
MKERETKEPPAIYYEYITIPLRPAIERVVSHLWDKEYADYQSASEAEKDKHIFRELMHLNQWLVDTECE